MFEIARRTFELPASFLKKYKNKQPDWGFGELGYFTYKRTYARPLDPEDHSKGTEEWWQTCQRVVEGTFSIQKNHCKSHHLPWDERKAQKSAKRMFELMWDFRFLPPGRGIWIMGTDHIIQHGSFALNNCGFTTTQNLEEQGAKPFCFLMDASMRGVGVGFDTLGAGSPVGKPKKNKETYVIPDTREGWVESVRLLIEAFLFSQPMPKFDYSEIREAGLPIRGFGGTASGPEPLRQLHESITEFLQARVNDELTDVDIVDINNMIGKCVVAGNVRRSAEIALGSYESDEFLKMKQDMEMLGKYRWASNNSIIADRGMDYSRVAKDTAVNGEPGYQWMENARAFGRMKDPVNWADKDAMGSNPCNEQTLHDKELCTLVETFPARHMTYEDYQETLKYAYLYAKTITLVATDWEDTNAVMSKNRRIGLSQSGIIQAFEKHGRRVMLDWCDRAYDYITGLDAIYSDWLGVPRSIKRTSVKPSGTVSLLCGATPGIHYPHSRYYIRRVRIGIHSPLVDPMRRAGYNVEPAVGQEDSTLVVEFPVEEKNFSRAKDDVSIWEQVANAVAYQQYWADNQVSITVTFNKDEAKDIKHILEIHEDSLKGISFLPLSDHGYEQAPYETIKKSKYDEMVAQISPIDFGDAFDHDDEANKFCDGDTCAI